MARTHLMTDLTDIQRAMVSATLRDGSTPPLLGTPRHWPHYRRLVRSITTGTLASTYPIARRWMGEDRWNELMDRFQEHAQPTEDCLWQMPGHLHRFAIDNDIAREFGLDVLNDLLLYEWTEVEVHTMPDPELPALDPDGDWRHGRLVVRSDHRILSLTAPVHRHHPDAISEEMRGPYHVLLHRHPITLNVQVTEITPAMARLVSKLADGHESIAEVVPHLLADARPEMVDEAITAAIRIMRDRLHEAGLVAGVRR